MGTGAGDPGPGTLPSGLPLRAMGGAATSYASRIESLGVGLPRHKVSSRDLVASCRHPLRLDLERLTGIRERAVCAEEEDAHSLALAAAHSCLARSRYDASDLELLISCSISKARCDRTYVFEPPMSLYVKNALGARQALSFDVTNACAGMLTGVAILDDFVRRGEVRCGMVVSGEWLTDVSGTARAAVSGMRSPQMAALTVGDAGAAVVLERAENGAAGMLVSELVSYAEHSDLCVVKPAQDCPRMAMYTDAVTLQRIAIEAAPPIIARVLERGGLTPDQIDCVIPHQTTASAIRVGTERFMRDVMRGFRGEVVYNLESYGNTASTTHFLALHRWLEEGRLADGQRVLLLCFASGIVVGAMLFTIDELAERYARSH